MKQIITALILLFSLTIQAQEYSYTITSEPGDSTFTLDNIVTLSDTRSTIDRTTGLDTTSLQQTQYARIERAYNEIAKLNQQIYAQNRLISSLRLGLNQVGIEDFNNNQISKLDSVWAADVARFITTGFNEVCYIQAREGNTHLVKRTSDDAVIGSIIPFAPNYIRLNIQAPFRVGGVTSVLMSATDTRDFRGFDVNNVLYRLVIIR